MKINKGFTIVELLIVIVVIAILAAISVVAYNGIQDRAYNSRVVSAVSQYHKAFIQYRTINGTYPNIDSCLGANYPNNACWAGAANGTSPQRSVNASLDSALAEFMPNKPEVATELINLPSIGYRAGIIYLPNDTTYPRRVSYYLKGNNQNCMFTVSTQVNEGPATQCTSQLPA